MTKARLRSQQADPKKL